MAESSILSKKRSTSQDNGLPVPSKGGISGRLSELLGLGFVATARTEVELRDEDSMTFRHVRKPVCWLTPAGIVGENE